MHHGNKWLAGLAGLGAAVLVFFCSPSLARAFTLVVQPGDTLAGIAQRIYGRVEYERLLVTANGLEAYGGIAISPGMRLEIPALAHRRVVPGDTWPALAAELLGSPERASVLAFLNDSKPWELPAENAEIRIPYNMRFVAEGGESVAAVAERFLGSARRARTLAGYNGFWGATLTRGQVLLIPLTDLPLTAAGRDAARQAWEGWGSVVGERRTQQASIEAELPLLFADIRAGRYAEAVARGVALLSRDAPTTPQRASIQRQLLEAFVALGATGRAADACREWRAAAPHAELDRETLSPKMLAACGVR